MGRSYITKDSNHSALQPSEFVYAINPSGSSSQGDSNSHAALLCRHCGHTVAHASMLTNEKSSLALRRYNMSVLGRNQLVQVFENPVRANDWVYVCKQIFLQAQMHATWFPEHEWTICVCSVCGAHLGWYFQPGNIQEKSAKSFVGLVLRNLISDDCEYCSYTHLRSPL
uniref:CULT domain-containing protein n=1 Tax=Ascaris lumbricoides TaxID=6252 RepID=A0A0M3HSW9_ASCLU